MGGQHAAVRVDEGVPRGPCDLALAGIAAHLAHRFHHVAHASGHAAVAEGQQTPVGVQRQGAAACEAAVANPAGRLAARGEAGFLQQHGQRDRERVIDAQVVDRAAREACFGEGGLRGFRGAGGHDVVQGGQVLVLMGLAGAAEDHAGLLGPARGNHQRHAAVGDRTAVQQSQRRCDVLGGRHIGGGDRRSQVGFWMARRMSAHQHGELRQVVLRQPGGMHVARCEQGVVGRHAGAVGHLEVGVSHLGQGLDGAVARLS